MQWSDALKLFVPLAGSFCSALLLIWARHRFTLSREFKNKSEYMWRTIKQNMGGYAAAFAALDEIQDNAKKGRFRVRVFYSPPADIDVAYRLAEIDSNYAYLYADFAAHAEMVRISFDIMTDLMQKLSVMPASQYPDQLDWLFQRHVTATKKNLIDCAHKSLDLMGRIQTQDSKNRDPHDVVKLRNATEDLQKSLNEVANDA
jgi:hypothetical protein